MDFFNRSPDFDATIMLNHEGFQEILAYMDTHIMKYAVDIPPTQTNGFLVIYCNTYTKMNVPLQSA